MRRVITRAAILVTLLAAAMAVTPSRQAAMAEDGNGVVQADRSLGESFAKKNKTTVGNLLDDNFEWTNADGKTRGKAETLQDLDEFAQTYTGDTNVDAYSYGELERIAGVHHSLNFIRLWVKRPAGWRAFIILEAPQPAKLPHPVALKDSDKDCENPRRVLPYTPRTAAEKAAMDTWLKLKMDEWHAIPDDWKTHVGESMLTISPTMSMSKAQRLDLLVQQKETYGSGSPSAPVVSMHMYEFGNAVVMTAHHGANAVGKPSYAVFANEGGDGRSF